MNTNETISKARGECRHDKTKKSKSSVYPLFECVECGAGSPFKRTQYDLDPTAWTPELYAWIEEKRLDSRYIQNLVITLKLGYYTMRMEWAWALLKATEPQKATALAQAITEKEG